MGVSSLPYKKHVLQFHLALQKELDETVQGPAGSKCLSPGSFLTCK